MHNIEVEVLIRNGCSYSDRVLTELKIICQSLPNIKIQIHNNSDPEPCRKSFAGITPSIWVNGKLWYLGSFNAKKFENKLKALTLEPSPKILL